MADTRSIKYFDVSIDKDNAEAEIKPMIYQLRPNWQDRALRVDEFTEGKMNKMLCYNLEEDGGRSDAIVVRLHLLDIGNFIAGYERQMEMSAMQLAHACGCFPEVYASFNNGVIYKYFKGRTLNFYDITNPKLIPILAKKICQFNMLDVESVDLVGINGGSVKFEKTGFDLGMIGGLLDKIPKQSSNPSRSEEFSALRKELDDDFFRREYDFLSNVLLEMQMDHSLAHGDFHPKNMILDEDSGDVCFVDYEITSWTYHCQDLARLFAMRFYMIILNMIDPTEPEITPEVRQLWLRSYLEAKYENEAKNPDDVTEDDVELLDIECTVVDVINDFRSMPFAFMDVPTKDVDILGLLPHVKERYYPRRAMLPALKTRYVELKAKITDKTL